MEKKFRVVKNFKIVKQSCSLNRYYRVLSYLKLSTFPTGFCYFLINFIELPTDQQAVKQEFEKFCAYCLRFSEYLPIVFIIGFFVSTIVSRWWDQFGSLPNPEQIAMRVVNFLPAKVIHSFRS